MGILIYLIVFAVSCGLLFLADVFRKNRVVSVLLEILAISLPILLAGLRDLSVGTDVKVYVVSKFNAVRIASSFINYVNTANIEVGFAALVYLVTKLTGSVTFVLLAIHTFIVVIIYLDIANHRDKIPVWLGMLVFYLLYFNMSLNIMRQWMAMAILLYASKYMFARRTWVYLAYVLIAACFHETAYVGIFTYLIYAFLNSRGLFVFQWGRYALKGERLRIHTVVVMIAIAFFSLLDIVAQFLPGLGLEKYAPYLRGGIVFSANQIILRLPLLILIFINRKEFFQRKEATFMTCMVILDLLLSQLAAGGNQSWRIALYFGVYSIFTYAYVCQAAGSKAMRAVSTGFVVVFLVAYWFYSYVLMGMHDTIPYYFTRF